MDQTITLEFDGGSRGNPGPAGIGVVLRAADGTAIFTLGRFIGRATNNYAEYQALVTGLAEAQKLGVKKIAVRGDSELVIKQMLGEYRVKNAQLRPLYEQAQDLFNSFESASISHNLRHHNTLADQLANKAMDRKADVTDAGDAPSTSPPQPSTSDVEEFQPGENVGCARCGCVVRVVRPSTIRPHQLKPFTCQCGQKMVRAPDSPER